MNNSCTTEQEAYAKARRQAAIKHKEAQTNSGWKTLFAIIITLMLMWWMSGCEKKDASSKWSTHTYQVLYTNGTTGSFEIKTHTTSYIGLSSDGHLYGNGYFYVDGVYHNTHDGDTYFPFPMAGSSVVITRGVRHYKIIR